MPEEDDRAAKSTQASDWPRSVQVQVQLLASLGTGTGTATGLARMQDSYLPRSPLADSGRRAADRLPAGRPSDLELQG